MSYLDHDYVERIFSHHPPKNDETAGKHVIVRQQVKQLAHNWTDLLPDGPEKTLAIRKLQEAMMFANSAIAQAGADG